MYGKEEVELMQSIQAKGKARSAYSNQVISFIQSKGGAGKSTLLSTLAKRMHRDGAKLFVIDTDEQKDSYYFCRDMDYENVDWAFIDDLEKLKTQMPKIKEYGYDAILIDTVGVNSPVTKEIAILSDLVFVPSKDDPLTMKGAARTFKRLKEIGMDHKCLSVLMDTDPNTRLSKRTTEYFDSIGIERLPVHIKHLIGFKEMMIDDSAGNSGPTYKAIEALMYSLQVRLKIDFYSKKTGE